MSDFFSRITAPIAGENPFGADVNHDTDYERLKSEMGKLGDIDIDTVEALSVKILTEKSKDMRAMAFLAYSMLRQSDIERLADVFCAIAYYCADGFESIFPQREGAKLAALRWFSDQRFGSQCRNADVSSVNDKPHVLRLKDALEKLKPALEKKFASVGAPFPNALYKRVTEWERTLSLKSAQEDIDGSGGKDQSGQYVGKSLLTDKKSSLSVPVKTVDTGEDIVIKLTREEYQEIISAVNIMEKLFKERR